MRCFGQHSRPIGADAEVDRQTASELNRVLNVESEEGRLRLTLKDERVIFVMGERSLTELSFFTFLFVGHKEREVFVKAEA